MTSEEIKSRTHNQESRRSLFRCGAGVCIRPKEELQPKCWEGLDTSDKLVVWVKKSFAWESWTQKLAKVTSEKTFWQHPHLIGTK